MKCLKTISNTFLIKFFEERLGQSDISTIGDGTILGAIKYLNSKNIDIESGGAITSSELEEIKKSINNINNKIGTKNISKISDGTILSAIDYLNSNKISTSQLQTLNSSISSINTKIGTSDIKKYGTTITGAIASLGTKITNIESSSGSSSISNYDIIWSNNSEDNQIFSAVKYSLKYNVLNYNFISVFYKDFLYYGSDERSYISGLFPWRSFSIGQKLTIESNIDIIRSRTFAFDSDGMYVTFHDCIGCPSYNNSSGNGKYNDYCVPIAIYGWK